MRLTRWGRGGQVTHLLHDGVTTGKSYDKAVASASVDVVDQAWLEAIVGPLAALDGGPSGGGSWARRPRR